MYKRVIDSIIIILFALCIAGCKNVGKEKEKLTPANAALVTYDYLYELAKNEGLPENTYIYSIEDMVSVTEYKGMAEYAPESISVSEEELNQLVEACYASYAVRNTVTEGKVKENDTISIDLVGTMNGDPIEEGLIDYEYTLNGDLIDELDDRLVGVKIGETFTIPCHFDENYANVEYAGKDVEFSIKVNYVIDYTYPEFDAEFFEKMAADNGVSGSYTDEDSFRNYKYKTLLEEKRNIYLKEVTNEAWNKVISNTEVTQIPQWDYDSAYSQVMDMCESRYSASESTYAGVNEYLHANGYEKTAQEMAAEGADKYVKEKLAVIYIAKKEKLTVTDEEYEACVMEYAKQYKYDDADTFLKALGDSKSIFITERYYEILYKKVQALIIERIA